MEESEGEVLVKGKVLEEQWGIWAIRASSATNKEIVVSGPDKIDFDKNTREFIVSIKYDNLFSTVDGRKFFEVFNKKTPDLIPYKLLLLIFILFFSKIHRKYNLIKQKQQSIINYI